jgi:hypothetical protein
LLVFFYYVCLSESFNPDEWWENVITEDASGRVRGNEK